MTKIQSACGGQTFGSLNHCNLEFICYLVLVIWDLKNLVPGQEEVAFNRILRITARRLLACCGR